MSIATTEELTATTVGHWIDGKPEAAMSGRCGDIFNPATGKIIAKVGFAGVEDVDRAVAAAKAAFPQWRAAPLSRRAEVMFRFRELIAENRRRLAEIISRENGKTAAERARRSGPRPGKRGVRLWHSKSP